jgi:tyrosinase
VKCLQTKPSKLDSAIFPGAKTRYDDFVAVHMNRTFDIHATANFLSWHRLYTWAYEQALRTECGYNGYQPYWNWGKWAFDPLNSPLFDGSDTSLSGNGAYAEHTCTNALPTNLNCIPAGEGGGCVTSGPFKDMVVNLGPIFPTLNVADVVPLPFDNFFGHNPRCLRRDISPWVSSNWTTDAETHSLLTEYGADIVTFQNRMQGDFPSGYFGVHTGGHYTLNGDPSGDFSASPGDPAFFLHHGQIDRVWWIWQNLKPEERTLAIGGTITIGNDPPSRDGRLDDVLDMGGVLGVDSLLIEKVMSTVGTTGGPLCYVYV